MTFSLFIMIEGIIKW